MEEDTNLYTISEFTEKVFIQETGRLIDSGFYHFAFVIMVQGLETLGSFLDNKPLKAKEQSKLRFAHAINRFMPHEYAQHNNNYALYNKLRASLAHTLTTSRHIYLSHKKHPELGNKHLHVVNDKLVLVCEDFYKGFQKACSRLSEAINKGIVSDRKKETLFYYTF